MTRYFKTGLAVSALALMAAAGVVQAQETTGSIAGFVADANGAPVAGADVIIVHAPTGITTKATTDATGYYAVDQLRVGGPYSVTIAAPGFKEAMVEVPYVSIGAATPGDVTVESATAPTEVVVTGRRRAVVAGRTTVGSNEVANTATQNRDIRDYALKSPSAWFDPTNSNALVIGGINNRSNAILIDGVKTGDDFGLNANGLPTLRSPISVDSVEAVNVDTAPFDVQYGFFQGGVINVVTKSGGNDFHGGFFYEKADDSLRGDHYVYQNTAGANVTQPVTTVFEEETYGFNLSGPIIKDKLFFFALYEKFEGSTPSSFGPSGSGVSNQVPGVTQTHVDQIVNIIKSEYGYDPLSWETSGVPVTDEKKQVKIDWQINDNHRAVFAYTDTQAGQAIATGNSTSATSGTLALLSKWYTLQTNMKVYKAQVFSDWNENFSTEFSYSRKEVVNISNPLAGDAFAEFRVYIAGGSGASVYLGPDISRQANQLTNDVDQLRFRGTYRTGDHRLTFGIERESVEVFNLFVQRANGQYVFNSIADLDNHRAQSLQYASAASNNKLDGGAKFAYSVNTIYVQDEWRITPRLTVTGGVRIDSYTSDDLPKANPAFEARYGFTNAKGLDGLSTVQPRFNFNWRPSFDDGLTIYGGIGKFQGGNPNVWISNQYTNTGNLLGTATCTRIGTTDNANCGTGFSSVAGVLNNVDGFNVPATALAANTASANLGTGNINALSETFKMPAVWKTSLGVSKRFDVPFLGENFRFTAEYTNTDYAAAPFWVDIYQELAYSGPAPDGRPMYYGTVNGSARANRTDVALTTVPYGDATTLSFMLSKTWTDGWAEGLGFDFSVALNDATDVNSGTSSVATSNLRQNATSDPQAPQVGTSNYQIDEMYKLTLNYSRKFFGDNETNVSLYVQKRSGQRFSYVYNDVSTTGAATGMFGENSLYTGTDRQLVYVPKTDSSGMVTATSDPIVKYATGFNFAAFNDFLNSSGLIDYAGSISPRNEFKSDDNVFAKIRVSQEIPAFFPSGAKAVVYLDVQNLGNAINDEWGVLQQYGFPYMAGAITARNCLVTGAGCTAGTGNYYQYDSFVAPSKTRRDDSSVYQIKVGIKYKF